MPSCGHLYYYHNHRRSWCKSINPENLSAYVHICMYQLKATDHGPLFSSFTSMNHSMGYYIHK